jgi:SNF2 family DNA or RNA helicase
VHGDAHKPYLPSGTLAPALGASDDSLEVHFKLDERSDIDLDFDSVLSAYRNGSSVVQLPTGGWAHLPLEWLNTVMPTTLPEGFSSSSGISKSRTALQLAPFIGDHGVDILNDFLSRVTASKAGPLPSLPNGLVLRSYQEQGVKWIRGMSCCGDIGVLLADDMGLGKTIQTLASLKFPALIIVPTTLLPQWESELRSWFPAHTLSLYHGSARAWDNSCDIVLTTYGIIRNESDLFSARNFEMIVLDEIQIIKNPSSHVSEAISKLKGSFRLGLTGTPVENSVIDLWSIFNFLNPGMLPEPEKLSRIAETDKGVSLARKLISGFILRRKKTEVLSELPEKTEILLSCEMSPEQRGMYESYLRDARKEAKNYFSGSKKFLTLFEKLLRLRQICVHPSLLEGTSDLSSAKMEVLLEYLERIVGSGHKVLVFSQWTSALDIVEPLIQSGIADPLRIDGSTSNRKAVLDSFKKDSKYPVLLLSLKAGGVGLNLVEADHVIFLDPWWNPAVEKQAEDRVYRIGQDNPVFIYRMIIKDSIEERILELHKKKSLLSEALLEGSALEGGAISEDDLRYLLSF